MNATLFGSVRECPPVSLDLSDPNAIAKIPESIVQSGRDLLSQTIDELPGALKGIADLARLRTRGRFTRELKGYSQRMGLSWRDLMLANLSYDLILAVFACSTIALATAQGPVVARNLDWFPERALALGTCHFKVKTPGGNSFQSASWFGGAGLVTGLSSRGFAVVLNAVSGSSSSALGYPVLLQLRRTIEDASGFQEALTMLSKTRLAAPCLITLAGRENSERVVIERGSSSFALRWPKDNEPLITTNHYIAMNKNCGGTGEIFETSCGRFEAMKILSSDFNPTDEPSDASLIEILTDPDVLRSITAQHILMRPRDNKMRVFVPSRFFSDQSPSSKHTASTL